MVPGAAPGGSKSASVLTSVYCQCFALLVKYGGSCRVTGRGRTIESNQLAWLSRLGIMLF